MKEFLGLQYNSKVLKSLKNVLSNNLEQKFENSKKFLKTFNIQSSQGVKVGVHNTM